MDESTYYHCHEDCNLCDGYCYLNDTVPEGCLVVEKGKSPGVYSNADMRVHGIYYVHANNPEDAQEKLIVEILKDCGGSTDDYKDLGVVRLYM